MLTESLVAEIERALTWLSRRDARITVTESRTMAGMSNRMYVRAPAIPPMTKRSFGACGSVPFTTTGKSLNAAC
jgi:hypothetical protein